MVANPLVPMVYDILGRRGYYGHVTSIELPAEEGPLLAALVWVQLSGCTGERSPIHELLTERPVPFFDPELEAAD